MSFLDRIFPSTAAPAGAAPGPEGAGPGPAPDGVRHSCPECGTPAAHDQEWCLECGSRIEETTPRWHQPAAVMASVGLILVAGLALALSEVAKDAEVAKAKTVRKYVAAAPAPAAPVPASPTPDPPKASDDLGTSTPETSPNTTGTPSSVPSDAAGAASASPDSGTSSGSGSSDTGSSGTSSGGGGGSSGGGGGSSGGGGSTTPAPTPVEEWPAGKKAWSVILLSTTSKDEAEALARKARAKGVPAGILESSKYKNLSDGLWMVWAGRFGTEDEAYAATDGYSAKGFTGESVEYVREKGSQDSSGDGSGTGGSGSDGKTTSTEGKTTSTETSPAAGGG